MRKGTHTRREWCMERCICTLSIADDFLIRMKLIKTDNFPERHRDLPHYQPKFLFTPQDLKIPHPTLPCQKSTSRTFPTLPRMSYSTHFATPLRPGATKGPGFITWHPSYVIQNAGASASANTIAVGSG